MTLDDIDRLHQRLEKVFDLIGEQQKILNECQGDLHTHLETSIVQVAGYDKDIANVLAHMQDLDSRVKVLEKYISDLESKKNGLESLATVFKWVIGTLIGLITLYTFWSKK